MIKFPSIKQFRDVVREVRRKAEFNGLDAAGNPIINPAPMLPTLRFRGSIKLHGTNAAIVFSPEGISFQSRERILTHESDNAGFYNHMVEQRIALNRIAKKIEFQLGNPSHVGDAIAIFGEWCGGNIQSGVALNGLPKMFVVFAIQVDGSWVNIEEFAWLTDNSASIYNICQFDQFDMTINFERPETAQNELGIITAAIEARCPVGAAFDSVGTGEGIVWRCVDDLSSDLWFKVKGEKHSASKVKTLAAVDVESITAVREFVDMCVTDARLEQGLQNLVSEQLKPFATASVGDFIRWVYADIIKEESDTITASGFDPKKLGGPIANASKKWFFDKLNASSCGHQSE